MNGRRRAQPAGHPNGKPDMGETDI